MRKAGKLKMEKNSRKGLMDSIVVGAALFSMFFGAGNMIFPPYLGLQTGQEWLSSFFGYYIGDIGLALVAMFTLIRARGHEPVMAPLGKKLSILLMSTIVLCLGPFIAIPRTAATTFELSVVPLLESFPAPLFYVLFFTLVLMLCLNQSAVVDIVGKVLTPVLFVGLLVLIALGVLNPLGPTDTASIIDNVFASGIQSGYQTMDVLATTIFGALILNSVAEKGHTDEKSQIKVSLGASLVAGIGLFIVYFGLTYLGATVSSIYEASMDRTQLLIHLIQDLMPGDIGVIFFAVVVCMACLTTAIALTSSAANYFCTISRGKLQYKGLVVIVCIFSAAISCVGTETIIALASPVLSIMYPPVLALVIFSFLGHRVPLWGCRIGTLAATLCGICEMLSGLGLMNNFLLSLPFGNLGFGWLIPSAIGTLLGCLIKSKKPVEA